MKWHVVSSLFVQVPRRAQSKAANAFDELHAAQQQLAGLAQPSYDSKGEMVLHYPECKILSVHNNKDQLHVVLFETFKRNGLGWMSKRACAQPWDTLPQCARKVALGNYRSFGQYWEANIASQAHGGIHSQVEGR